MANRKKPADDRSFERTVKSPAGNDYTVTSPTDYYNLLAQGYADSDPKSAAKALADAEASATSQPLGPGDAATAAKPGDGAKG